MFRLKIVLMLSFVIIGAAPDLSAQGLFGKLKKKAESVVSDTLNGSKEKAEYAAELQELRSKLRANWLECKYAGVADAEDLKLCQDKCEDVAKILKVTNKSVSKKQLPKIEKTCEQAHAAVLNGVTSADNGTVTDDGKTASTSGVPGSGNADGIEAVKFKLPSGQIWLSQTGGHQDKSRLINDLNKEVALALINDSLDYLENLNNGPIIAALLTPIEKHNDYFDGSFTTEKGVVSYKYKWKGEDQFEVLDTIERFKANELNRILALSSKLPIRLDILTPISFGDYDFDEEVLAVRSSPQPRTSGLIARFERRYADVPRKWNIARNDARELLRGQREETGYNALAHYVGSEDRATIDNAVGAFFDDMCLSSKCSVEDERSLTYPQFINSLKQNFPNLKEEDIAREFLYHGYFREYDPAFETGGVPKAPFISRDGQHLVIRYRDDPIFSGRAVKSFAETFSKYLYLGNTSVGRDIKRIQSSSASVLVNKGFITSIQIAPESSKKKKKKKGNTKKSSKKFPPVSIIVESQEQFISYSPDHRFRYRTTIEPRGL